MTTYDQTFGHLHATLLPPKKGQSALGRPPGDPGGPVATPLRKAKPEPSTTPQRPRPGDVAKNPPVKAPPPPGSLGIPDLPPEIEAVVAQILAADPTNGAARALAYIRGTDWYKQAYYGIGGGIKSGIIGNEADYRSYVSSVKQSFAQYYGRDPTQAELADYLARGYTPGVVDQIGGGHAWATANRGDTQYLLGAFDTGQLSDAELEALGQQQVGRGSTAGAAFQARLQQAGAKMSRLFEGVAGSPSFQLGSGGLSAPSLQTKQKPDVGA